MKDPSDNIRDWLYGVLHGMVWYNSTSIPVYSFAPKDTAFPYILIGEQSMFGEDGTKDRYISEHSVIIEIWTEHKGNDASYVMANSIGDSVLQIVRQRTIENEGSGGSVIPSVTGFNAIRIIADNLITDRILMDNSIQIYKSITIKLLLEEN